MKDIEKIVSVSGLPGLYLLESTRNNGLVISNLETGEKQFVSIRKHQFSPLRSLAIYTYMDSTPVEEIFSSLLKLEADSPASEVIGQDDASIRNYFRKVLPEYDEDRVSAKDMKKVLKWYDYLKNLGMLSAESEVQSDKEEE